ncbi:MAG: TrpR-related protein YerC/YecD [Parcubacteria group bacterium GW2011_GWB1_36_5]|nr:MAG: TrpR-related protein YerC/YecD [Parcubacteria group bacterium GW2011_GWA2_36_24]KKQ07667.1 MAG: TrpR-related protein YerC/YecD [Parcubacteria group bacterium GW2011_GWB1_36_5]
MSKGMNDNTRVKTVRLIKEIGPDTDWYTKENKQLVAGILALKNENEAKRFLRDLLTPIEIKEFGNRLEAARLLSEDMQYNAISERTGLSSSTIARIAKWLGGSLGGYRLVLSRLSKHHHNSSKLGKGLILSS